MRGEKLFWFILADRLKTPLQELKVKTTSNEFVDWMVYLEKEPNLFHREDYYLAQIAAFIVKANTTKKNVVIRLKDFLLKFVPEQTMKSVTKEQRLQRSKQFWFNLVGITKKKRKK